MRKMMNQFYIFGMKEMKILFMKQITLFEKWKKIQKLEE